MPSGGSVSARATTWRGPVRWMRSFPSRPTASSETNRLVVTISRGRRSSLLSSGRTRGGDGPVEGTYGRAGDRVEQARDGEAPGGASEPTRTARDGRRFHNGEDSGCRRW